VGSITTAPAWAQQREFNEHAHVEARPERAPGMERPLREDRFRSSHWIYDSHHRLNHYFPARGEVVPALPGGAVSVDFAKDHYFFHGGVFFRPTGTRFAVVAPPLGIVVPLLPPAYVTLWSAGVPYYYANDVYYTVAPRGGYVVAAAPPGLDDADVIAQAPLGDPPAPGSSSNPIVYPRNNQAPAQTSADRADCNEWATTQEQANDPTAYRRAFAACMDGRGYTVR
jgi:hypothetical protein